MDWVRAIEINRAALVRIVAALVALMDAQGGAKRLPRPLFQAIARMLYPAESAVRRLILVAARKLVVPLPPRRAMPQGLVIARAAGDGPGRMAFQLFDRRKTFSDDDGALARSGPRIRSVGDPDPRSRFLAQFAKSRDDLSTEAETLRLRRRLEAAQRALSNLKREARRMARWRARRAKMENPKLLTPIRPGPPPGQRKRGTDEIDRVLRECHGLAWDVLREDTS